MTLSLDEWFAGGERILLPLPAPATTRGVHIFSRVAGAGVWLTLLHGFPSCSWDWARISPLLEPSNRLLMFDFLGFGDSDKPTGHRYSLFEQANLTEALWRRLGVEHTSLVAHDYGATVALELLSRQAEGRLATRVERCILMNAGLYIDLQRPVLAQRLLEKPVLGTLLDHLISERMFSRQFSSVFAPDRLPSPSDLHQYWSAVTRRGGLRNYHRLISYLSERRQHKLRWEGSLERAGVPLRFIWGLADPVSGKHIADEIRRRIPGADLVELPRVGHYPQLEIPERVVREINQFR